MPQTGSPILCATRHARAPKPSSPVALNFQALLATSDLNQELPDPAAPGWVLQGFLHAVSLALRRHPARVERERLVRLVRGSTQTSMQHATRDGTVRATLD